MSVFQCCVFEIDLKEFNLTDLDLKGMFYSTNSNMTVVMYDWTNVLKSPQDKFL